MCKICSEAVKRAVANGHPEDVAVNWLWEDTPFPVGDPTNEQIKEMDDTFNSPPS